MTLTETIEALRELRDEMPMPDDVEAMTRAIRILSPLATLSDDDIRELICQHRDFAVVDDYDSHGDDEYAESARRHRAMVAMLEATR